ncbi:MAG: hypothetical protein ACFFDT_34995 [Candidatus Hodarchaeota archaeon]
MQRAPYVEEFIGDISKSSERVRIVGTCVYVDTSENFIVVADATGQIQVNVRESSENLDDLMSKIVRVLGTVIAYPDSGKIEINADFVRKFPVDLEKYQFIRQIENLTFKEPNDLI